LRLKISRSGLHFSLAELGVEAAAHHIT
jgi:hypothetical protein